MHVIEAYGRLWDREGPMLETSTYSSS